QTEAAALVGHDGGPATESTVDDYGYTWLTVRTDPPDPATLVTDLHAVNSALEAQGFSSSLLCSVVSFVDDAGQRAHLVYLYKRGTFYPFAPLGGERRDNELELRVKATLEGDLPIEPELGRWFALWGLPLG
ncbi:MAG: hypothetical protein ABW234_09210, partial [Actinomycetes bacterium]